MAILTVLIAPPFLAWLFYEVVVKGGREFDDQMARTQARVDELQCEAVERRRYSVERYGYDIYEGRPEV